MSKFKSLDAVHSSSDVSDIAPEELASIAHVSLNCIVSPITFKYTMLFINFVIYKKPPHFTHNKLYLNREN